MLNSLPPEIVLQILSYFPVSSLANIHSLSRTWNTFLLHHETTIYRHAACLHGIIHDDAASLDAAMLGQKYSQRVLRNVDSWKALCKTRIRIRNAWNGVAPSQTLPKSMAIGQLRESVHRIKVDEQRKLIISTTGMDFPRVEVRDMETGRDLWFLEPSMGRMYAHLEYSNGFLIFDRSSGDREVWRLCDSEIFHPVPCSETPPEFDLTSRPDVFMLDDSERALGRALEHYPDVPDLNFRPRGCFEPYAALHSPEETRAYRFVYPTLLTASRERVYMWDVPSARIVEVFSGIQKARIPNPADRVQVPRPLQVGADGDSSGTAGGLVVEDEIGDNEEVTDVQSDDDEEWSDTDTDSEEEDTEDTFSPPADVYLLGPIIYVDHCPTHTFLAGRLVLKVFTRASVTEDTSPSSASGFTADARSTSHLALAITSTKLRYGRWKYTVKPGSRRPQPDSALVPYKVEVSTMESPPTGTLYDQFKAVHVSPCGSHVVALLYGVRLLIIPHFKNLVGQPEQVIYNHTLDVQLGSPAVSKSIYLAYEEGDGGEGKVGVVTSTAVFVITIPCFPSDYSLKTPPLLRISRAKELMDPQKLGGVSCLMMSDTGLFLNFDPSWSTYGTERRARLLHDWEQKFEESLRDVQRNELECYRRKKDVFFIRDLPDLVDFRAYSTIYEVDMFPS